MMMGSRRRSDASRRFEERRERERNAQRLRQRVPALATLRLELRDSGNATAEDMKHSRLIHVETAPALFVMPCADHSCREGGHDVTASILDGLAAGRTDFVVDDVCYGSVGTASCGRALHVLVTSTYR